MPEPLSLCFDFEFDSEISQSFTSSTPAIYLCLVRDGGAIFDLEKNRFTDLSDARTPWLEAKFSSLSPPNAIQPDGSWQDLVIVGTIPSRSAVKELSGSWVVLFERCGAELSQIAALTA